MTWAFWAFMGVACAAEPRRVDSFRPGYVLVVDAVAGATMEGVTFQRETGHIICAKSILARQDRDNFALGSSQIPITVRVVWRDHAKPIWGQSGRIEYEGAILGDYTTQVAARLPDEILREIESRGGALRLKFRLKPDGVLFGWDIERTVHGSNTLTYDMPGGEFIETRY